MRKWNSVIIVLHRWSIGRAAKAPEERNIYSRNWCVTEKRRIQPSNLKQKSCMRRKLENIHSKQVTSSKQPVAVAVVSNQKEIQITWSHIRLWKSQIWTPGIVKRNPGIQVKSSTRRIQPSNLKQKSCMRRKLKTYIRSKLPVASSQSQSQWSVIRKRSRLHDRTRDSERVKYE